MRRLTQLRGLLVGVLAALTLGMPTGARASDDGQLTAECIHMRFSWLPTDQPAEFARCAIGEDENPVPSGDTPYASSSDLEAVPFEVFVARYEQLLAETLSLSMAEDWSLISGLAP